MFRNVFCLMISLDAYGTDREVSVSKLTNLFVN